MPHNATFFVRPSRRMPTSSDRLFALPAVRTLLDLELADLAPQLAGLYGAQGLFVRAHVGAPKVVSAPMLGRLVRLHVESPEHFGGDAACASRSLPFADDSFRLVLVQHAAECLADAAAFQSEVARVLAPEGVAIVVGFAALSPWRGWLAARARRDGAGLLQRDGAARWRRRLAAQGVDVYAVRRIGSAWPQSTALAQRGGLLQRGLDPLRASYMLLARKRREAATPLRLLPASELSLRVRLAPGTQRACA
jgi:SAM-dependent methyltransferase